MMMTEAINLGMKFCQKYKQETFEGSKNKLQLKEAFIIQIKFYPTLL